ncbi:MAG TPA: response regulator [bacterium]|nr:response regulator [bacterium]
MTINNINFENSKILVVDDEKDCLDTIKIMLNNSHYILIFCNKGSECIEIVEKEKPDLILLDIMMPDISGLDICKKLKLNKQTLNIPVIFLTALEGTTNIVNALKFGAVDYLVKPFAAEELNARVETHLKTYFAIKNLESVINKHNHKNALLNSNLTERELEICELIKNKLSSKMIASELNISLLTVERHRFNIRNKLKLSQNECLATYLSVASQYIPETNPRQSQK